MKCFDCKSKCITLYWSGGIIIDFKTFPSEDITHVNSACTADGCGWQSFRTKIPESI